MATRFYLEPTIAAPVNPSFDAGWEQTGQAVRRAMRYKKTIAVATALANSGNITIPITTTQDILCYQFVSEPLLAQRLIGTCSFVMRCQEASGNGNATLAGVLKVVRNDGALKSTLFSVFGTGTEFVTTTAATRFWSASAITGTTIETGDRLVLEIGAHVAAPIGATTYVLRSGFSAAADLAYSSGVTTDNNPSLELSQDIWAPMSNNYRHARAASGISVSEGIR